jgi:threonine dehydrogenase-like Zn-dependent dehydrogenase
MPEPDEGEALVRVRLAGVCATDLEIVRGYMDFRGVLGHEFVGEVAGPEEVRSLRGGRWPAVVEATGSPGGVELALSLTAPRGVMVLKSTVAVPATVDFAPLVIDEITVIGSRCGPFPPALSALAGGEIRTFPMIDARFPLQEAPRALARAGAKGTLKVIVAPRDGTIQT